MKTTHGCRLQTHLKSEPVMVRVWGLGGDISRAPPALNWRGPDSCPPCSFPVIPVRGLSVLGLVGKLCFVSTDSWPAEVLCLCRHTEAFGRSEVGRNDCSPHGTRRESETPQRRPLTSQILRACGCLGLEAGWNFIP